MHGRPIILVFAALAVTSLCVYFVTRRNEVSTAQATARVSSPATTSSIETEKLIALVNTLQHGMDNHLKETGAVLVKVIEALASGYRHARSAKTMRSIQVAHASLTSLLTTSLNNITAQTQLVNEYLAPVLANGTDVCPEIWPGMKHGYPYYHYGHDLANCTHAPKMSEIATLVLHFREPEESDKMEELVAQVRAVHADLPVVILSPRSFDIRANGTLTVIGPNFPGQFATALDKIKTKYTIFASELYYFDNDTRFDRMIRMIDVVKSDVAAGSHRNESGHWFRGCYQSKMEYYKYKLVNGYDVSYNSCIYCDYVSGPFAARTELLRATPLDNSDQPPAVALLDYFETLKKGGKIISNCPDAMFHTNALSLPQKWGRGDLLSFAKKHQLEQIIFPEAPLLDGSQQVTKFSFTCSELGHTCASSPPKGIANYHCCSLILQKALAYVFAKTAENEIELEMDAGNVVGAVKLANVLPWERDSDLNYRGIPKVNQKMTSLIPQFTKDGYNLYADTACSKTDKENFTCNYFGLKKSPWRIELWGNIGDHMAQEITDAKGLNHTLVYIDGNWYTGYYNPAKFARNRYGDDVFRHIEHWGAIGLATSWKPFEAGWWQKCAQPGFHGCLDVWLPVGDLQLWEPSI